MIQAAFHVIQFAIAGALVGPAYGQGPSAASAAQRVRTIEA